MKELLQIPVFASRKKKASRKGHLAWTMDDIIVKPDRSKHFMWSPEDVEITNGHDRSGHLYWDKNDIIIHKLGKNKIESWEASYFPETEESKTHAHLSTRQKESLENPGHLGVKNSAEEHAKNLDESHHEAVHDYQNSSSSLNASLRGAPLKKPTPAFKKYEKDATEKLDQVTNHKLPHDTVTYRGVHHSMATLPSGTTFEDKGYTGTSLSHAEAKWFAPTEETKKKSKEPERSPKKHVARLFIKKGEKGGYLPKSHGSIKNAHDHEEELLMPRNTHYKVLGHSKEGGVHYVDMEVHHPHGKTEATAVWS